MKKVRSKIRQIIAKCGYRLRLSKVRPEKPDCLKFDPNLEDKDRWLSDLDIDTVVDIGAHEGQAATMFLNIFPSARIYSFEPLGDCYAKLLKLSNACERLTVFNKALGACSGTLKMNRSSFSPSSSLLKMEAAHKQAFPFTSSITEETVMVSTLDEEASNIPPSSNVMLKIDAQGYEMQVLLGATAYLKHVKVIIAEVSFVSLYCNQPLFEDIYNFLSDRGFAYRGSWGQLFDPRNGRPIQQDAVFMRT